MCYILIRILFLIKGTFMTIEPSINLAVQAFSNADERGCYINSSLEPTKHKSQSASLEVVSTLAENAIKELRNHFDRKTQSPENIQSSVKAIKNYLIRELQEHKKVKAHSIGKVALDEQAPLLQTVSKIVTKVESEIEDLTELEFLMTERPFTDTEITTLARKPDYLNFEKYGIKSEKTKVRLAHAIATKRSSLEGEELCQNIRHFGIKDKEARFSIACALMRTPLNTIWVGRYVKNFGIEDEAKLLYIARKMFSNEEYADNSAAVINNLGIKDQKTLIELAKLALKHNFEAAEHIQKFGIKDPNVLIDLAKMLAEAHGIEFFGKYINYFEISNHESYGDVAASCIKYEDKGIYGLIQKWA